MPSVGPPHVPRRHEIDEMVMMPVPLSVLAGRENRQRWGRSSNPKARHTPVVPAFRPSQQSRTHHLISPVGFLIPPRTKGRWFWRGRAFTHAGCGRRDERVTRPATGPICREARSRQVGRLRRHDLHGGARRHAAPRSHGVSRANILSVKPRGGEKAETRVIMSSAARRCFCRPNVPNVPCVCTVRTFCNRGMWASGDACRTSDVVCFFQVTPSSCRRTSKVKRARERERVLL